MDKLTSYDICTKYGCLSRIFTLITYYGFCNRGWIPLESADV